MKNVMIVLIAMMFVLGSINAGMAQHHEGHKHHDAHTDATHQMDHQVQAPEAFQQQLAQVYNSYISMKDALVSSKPGKAGELAKEVSSQLDKVDMALLKGEAHMKWMDYLKEMKSSLQVMLTSENLKEQRQALATLSTNLYHSIKAFGMKDQKAFYQYCPMANHNEGAYWLSSEKGIRNPYFGASMLKCGSVKEEL